MHIFACKFMIFFSISSSLRNCNNCNYRVHRFTSQNIKKYVLNLFLNFNFKNLRFVMFFHLFIFLKFMIEIKLRLY